MLADPARLLDAWAIARAGPANARLAAVVAVLAPEAAGDDTPVTTRERTLAAMLDVAGQEALADCPACGAVIEISVPGALLAAPVMAGDGLPCRLPTASDIAAVAGADDPPHRLAERLASRPLSASEARAMAAALLAAEPLLDPAIACACPACGSAVTLGLDLAAFSLALFDRQARRLLAEVDSIARGYGWAEADILALPQARRAHYAAMLAA